MSLLGNTLAMFTYCYLDVVVYALLLMLPDLAIASLIALIMCL